MDKGKKFAHVYEINSYEVKAYLLPGTESLVQAHLDGVSRIARIGSYVIIESGGSQLVGKVISLNLSDPEKLFWLKTNQSSNYKEIVRTMTITLIGQFYGSGKEIYFERGITIYPSIDEGIYVPTQDQLNLILNEKKLGRSRINLGTSYTNPDIDIELNPIKLFSRHVAVVGSTGNGKSCTVTVLVKELLMSSKKTSMPIIIFDINGEYTNAFAKEKDIKVLSFGDNNTNNAGNIVIEHKIKIDFNSFSRRTWRNMLMPSEKTQIPALNFAIDCLPYLGYKYSDLDSQGSKDPTIEKFNFNHSIIGASICGHVDESNSTIIENAKNEVEELSRITELKLKIKSTSVKSKVFDMSILAKLITDRWAIAYSRNAFTYDPFKYGNIASLCDRITEYSRDPLFNLIFDSTGTNGKSLLNITKYSEKLIILDFSGVAQEYMPIMVDSILEQFLIEALTGQYRNNPHMLVLDEAHHYLKPYNYDGAYLGTSPGERIAKEGRKFGLHLLIATQRPRELSDTIISQVSTVISHALTQDADKAIIASFGNYSDKSILDSISILPRQEAIIIGQAVTTPTRMKIRYLDVNDRPLSKDPLEDTFIN